MSERAKTLLKDLLPQRPDPTHVFRLSRQGSGIGLRFDAPADGDIIFKHDTTDVLAVAPDVAESLNGTIDREDAPDGPRLVLVR